MHDVYNQLDIKSPFAIYFSQNELFKVSGAMYVDNCLTQ